MFTVDHLQMALVYHHYDCLKVMLAASNRPLQQQELHTHFTGISSLYHLAVKHKCNVNFLELMFEFGLNPWIRDARQLYPWETTSGDVMADQTRDLMMFFKIIRGKLQSFTRVKKLFSARFHALPLI